ncbi:MAG TPA: hypothetical protein VL282_18905, partial [Tepidisphaeraceae bacterium]|nr:hypothetical protein [Tepidisphaeraceae bacterium]
MACLAAARARRVFFVLKSIILIFALTCIGCASPAMRAELAPPPTTQPTVATSPNHYYLLHLPGVGGKRSI